MVNSATHPEDTLYQVAATATRRNRSARRARPEGAAGWLAAGLETCPRFKKVRMPTAATIRSDASSIAANNMSENIDLLLSAVKVRRCVIQTPNETQDQPPV